MLICFIVKDDKRFELWFMDIFNDIKMFYCDVCLGNFFMLILYCGLFKYIDNI